MPVTTNFAIFIARANQTPLTTQRPCTPSPTHTRLNRIVDVGLEDRVDWRKQQGLVRQNAVKCMTDEDILSERILRGLYRRGSRGVSTNK